MVHRALSDKIYLSLGLLSPLNSGLGVMNKSNRFHVRIQEFLSDWGGGGGGGGVEAPRPENSDFPEGGGGGGGGSRGPTARKQ